MFPFARRFLALTALAVVAACDQASPPDDPALAPIRAGDQLVALANSGTTLVVMTPADGRIDRMRRVPLSHPAVLLTALPGRNAVLALSRKDRTVELVDTSPDAAPDARRVYAIGTPFEALTVSDDSRFAVAWFPPNTASAVFHNENEVALIDLRPDTSAETAVSRRTLPSLGGAPRAIVFSPPVNSAGRRYLFALSSEHVAIAATDAPDRRERSVPLVSLTSGGRRTPTALTFGLEPNANGTPTLFGVVVTEEANSVYALAITPRAEAPDNEADFDVNLSQLAGIGPGGAATLVTLPAGTLGPEERLATLTTHPGAGTLTLTDVRTATGRTLALGGRLNRIVLFRGERGTDEALVYAANNNSATFHVVDIAAFASGETRASRTRTTHEPFATLLPIPDSARFVVVQSSSTTAVGILDADTDRIAGFGRTGTIRALELDIELDRLFALTTVDNREYVVSVDLADLHPEASPVPHRASHLFILPDSGTIATWGALDGGLLVTWPAFSTLPESSTAYPGYLFDGLLR